MNKFNPRITYTMAREYFGRPSKAQERMDRFVGYSLAIGALIGALALTSWTFWEIFRPALGKG